MLTKQVLLWIMLIKILKSHGKQSNKYSIQETTNTVALN